MAVSYCLVEMEVASPSLSLVADDYELRSQTAVGSPAEHKVKLRLRWLCLLVSAICLDSAGRCSTVDNHCSIEEVHLGLWAFLSALHKLVLV